MMTEAGSWDVPLYKMICKSDMTSTVPHGNVYRLMPDMSTRTFPNLWILKSFIVQIRNIKNNWIHCDKWQDILTSPFSEEDYTKAEKLLKEAEHCYTSAMISEHKSDVLDGAGGVIYYVENAIAMLNKQYFHYGVKRAYEELNAMQNRPEKLCDMIDDVISATSVTDVKKHLSTLIKETIAVFHNVKETIAVQKKPATGDVLTGTYEEMYSNWRNKMYAAAETGDRHLAFMSLLSSNAMFSEISSEVDISQYDVLGGYNSQDLHKTAKAYDDILSEYLKEYRKADIQVKHYSDIEAFVLDYQRN